MMARIVTRAIFAVIAIFFLLGALTFGHVAAWYEIRTALDQSYLATAGILGGIDLLLAVILLFLASRSTPSRVEVEAQEVRRKALQGIASALSLTQLLLPLVLRVMNTARRRGRS
jgi:uncharacterized membrane protein YedE/YeeE